MQTTQNPSTLLDVLSGNEAIKAEVAISNQSIIILCASVLVVIVLGALIIKKI